MGGVSSSNLFQGQMDYVFFFQGLAFFLISVVCLLFRGQGQGRTPWLWLGLFGLAQGLAAWMSLLSVNFGDQRFLKVLAGGLKLTSLICLAEFGRAGLSRTQSRDAGLWLLTLLLMLSGLGGLKGWPGLELAGGYALGLVGGLWAAAAILVMGQESESIQPGSRWLAGGCLGVLAVSSALFPSPSGLFPATYLNKEVFLAATGLPLEFCQGLLAFGLAAGIYAYLPLSDQTEAGFVSRYRSRYMFGLLVTLSLILGLGSVLTQYLGELAHDKIKTEAQEYAAIVVHRLNTEFKRMEDAARSMAESPYLCPALVTRKDDTLDKANQVLDRYKDALDASVCYLMDRRGKTLASSNRRAPDSFVGHSYAFRPYFKQAVGGAIGRYFAVGVTSQVPGYYVSHPVQAPTETLIRGVAVIKVTLDNIAQELAATVQRGSSLVCLTDPHGVVFLSSQPELIFKSLWPVEESVKPALRQQFGKDWFPNIFPVRLSDGDGVRLNGRQYLASYAGTFHAGWSVYFFRPIERIGMYRLTGITAACILSILALFFLGSSFAVREQAALSRASEGKFRAIFEAVPAGVLLFDLETRRVLEANPAVAQLLGYSRQELLDLRLEDLLQLQPQEIQEQLRYLGSEPDIWQQTCPVRRQDGGQLNLELAGVRLQGGGSRQILLLCREAAAAPPAAEAGALGEVQLAQKRRLEAVGTQVGAMAHDFNNLLASLIMQLELSLGEVPEASHMRANLDDMMESAMQAKDLVRQLAAQPLPAAAASQPEGPVGDRILLVDDEEQLCRLEEKLLQRLGYQVAAFTNSAMALEAFRQDPGGYDLVISDCSMSDLPGLELAQELLRLRPELPIILATGFGETNLLEQAQQIGIRECLEKPILARDLDKAIRRVLEVQRNLFPQN